MKRINADMNHISALIFLSPFEVLSFGSHWVAEEILVG